MRRFIPWGFLAAALCFTVYVGGTAFAADPPPPDPPRQTTLRDRVARVEGRVKTQGKRINTMGRMVAGLNKAQIYEEDCLYWAIDVTVDPNTGAMYATTSTTEPNPDLQHFWVQIADPGCFPDPGNFNGPVKARQR